MKLEFSRHMLEKYFSTKYHVVPCGLTEGRTDRKTDEETDMAKKIISFRNLRTRLKWAGHVWFFGEV